eukprot:3488646-Amphidinium_carterae.1
MQEVIALAGQEVMVDGELFEAPPGNLMFTGPGGSLLHFQKRVLLIDLMSAQLRTLQILGSVPAERFLPVSETASMMVWNFRIPDTGATTTNELSAPALVPS